MLKPCCFIAHRVRDLGYKHNRWRNTFLLLVGGPVGAKTEKKRHDYAISTGCLNNRKEELAGEAT